MANELEPTKIANPPIGSRLGKCEVCAANEAKYTCPKCDVKTCCLKCQQIHKKELSCNGIRDRTKFIPIKKMTKMDFMNDYYFLEECTRFTKDIKSSRLKRCTRYNKVLPTALFRLKIAAKERTTTLRFLLDSFSRRKANTSYFDSKSNRIFWRVEWVFLNASNLKYIDAKCSEEDFIDVLLDKYVNIKNPEEVPNKKCLQYYQSQGMHNLSVMLKAEGISKCKNRFYRLDVSKTLKDNLAGKVIVENPCIYVTYHLNDLAFDVIDSDEDLSAENEKYQKVVEKLAKTGQSDASGSKINTDDLTSNKTKSSKQAKKRKHSENETKNYLFSNEQCDDMLSSTSDDESLTEEESEPSTSSTSRENYSLPPS